MHIIFWGMPFTEITRDRVFLAYAFMTIVELNIGAIYKSSMWKACMH